MAKVNVETNKNLWAQFQRLHTGRIRQTTQLRRGAYDTRIVQKLDSYISPWKCRKDFILLWPIPGRNIIETSVYCVHLLFYLTPHPLLLKKRRRMLRGSEAKNRRANVSEGVRNLDYICFIA